MSGAYTDSSACSCCGSSQTAQVTHERRGDFVMKQCGGQEPKDRNGCGYVWEETSTWAREKTGVGNVNHAGARTDSAAMDLGTLPDGSYARIFGHTEPLFMKDR